jgi:hypothetical protein
MSFWEKIFGDKSEQKVSEPQIQFGRYSDSYKEKAQYEAWDESLKQFEDENYLESYKIFFRYLRDDKEDNVRWVEENGGIRFEILQGSKRLSGFADARHLHAVARIAHARELSVAFMRRLVESNYSLDYSRYALDDDNNLVIKFDTSTLDGSPYKLYYALKEVAINADKQDDLLIDEFETMLDPLDLGSKKDISSLEKDVKYHFIKDNIEGIFTEMDKGSLNAEKYPGGISYLLLSAVYKIDYLTSPEGFLMETIERIHRSYFDTDGKTSLQKNVAIRKELEKVLSRSEEILKGELYATTSTFGILSPNQQETLVTLIDGELPNMDWYEENKHTKIALSVPGYIVGNALFNYALPKPTKELLALYYRIIESDFFKDLGFTPQYFDAQTETFVQKDIKNAVRKVVDANKEKYKNLSPDFAVLDFKTPCRFARTYLMMIRNLDLNSAS